MDLNCFVLVLFTHSHFGFYGNLERCLIERKDKIIMLTKKQWKELDIKLDKWDKLAFKENRIKQKKKDIEKDLNKLGHFIANNHKLFL